MAKLLTNVQWDNPSKNKKVLQRKLLLKFSTKEKAVEYAKNNKISYKIIEPKKKEFVIKSYADNFLKN